MDKTRILKVVYKCEQGPEDLYWCNETKKVYIRQPCNDKSKVYWLTSSKWQGGYEASSPIRAGITMQVVDKDNNFLFEETLLKDEHSDITSAKKVGDFTDEAIRKIAKTFGYGKDLKTHDEWKSWLLLDKDLLNNTCSYDEWLYCLQENRTEVVGVMYYLGKKALLAKEYCKHKVSKKEWVEFLLLSEDKTIVLEIAGYMFDESSKLFHIEMDEIDKCRDKVKLYSSLSVGKLLIVNDILKAYYAGEIDIKEPRDIKEEPDYDGHFELDVKDKKYVETGYEMIVLKWVNDYIDTDLFIEYMSLETSCYREKEEI